MRMVPLITGLFFSFLPASALSLDLKGKSILYKNDYCSFAIYMSKDGVLYSEYSDDNGGKGMIHKQTRSCQSFTLRISGKNYPNKPCGKYTLKGNKLIVETSLSGIQYRETYVVNANGSCTKRSNKTKSLKCQVVSGRQIYSRC